MPPPVSPPSTRVHAVLGMHRSGTSWLAGSLEQKGLALGEVNQEATYNRKGTREHDTLQAVHVSVLRSSGGSWREPPRRVVWGEHDRARLREFVAEMDASFGTWGFKDPRTLLVLDEWKRQLGDRLAFVGIYRHPAAVARSLEKRQFSPVPIRAGLKLWRVYNERLVAEHRRGAFPIVRFDVARAPLLAALDAIAAEWALPSAATPSTFFEQDLVDEAATDEPVPRGCRRLWDYLERAALDT